MVQVKVRGSSFHADELTHRLDVGVEIDTGRRYLGKQIYRMLVNITAGPAANTVSIAHGISNIDQVVKIQGVMKTDSVPNWFPIPYPSGNNLQVLVDSTNVNLTSAGVFSDAHGFIEIEYTHS